MARVFQQFSTKTGICGGREFWLGVVKGRAWGGNDRYAVEEKGGGWSNKITLKEKINLAIIG